MEIIYLNADRLRAKAKEKTNKYLSLSKHNRLTIGLYKDGRFYVFGDEGELSLYYDIGSVTKTVTAHLILKLYESKMLELDETVDKYLPLKSGKYPTVYQLLTHTAGYHHLTPVELTLPSLACYGYARKNPYESCNVKKVIKSLERRRFITPRVRYGYSDFASAILAAVAEQITETPFYLLLEDFLKNDLGLGETCIELPPEKRDPPATKHGRLIPFWKWKKQNPYIAGGA